MMPLGSGVRVGPYEIVDTIGSGGMGVVYRARDTQLHRMVALKVLIEESAEGGGTDLLLHEARAASALNHPNICTVHEVREETGRLFIVMEYVDGRALHEQIPSHGLPTDTVLRYAAQVVDALAHAHYHGVLHRDLKSANVIVTGEGRAKIVDFGLARRLTRASHDDVTRSKPIADTDSVGGTLAYMAPELLTGDSADARSDIWSFGVLLYEMATGRLPFTGRTPFDTTAAILRAPLPPFPTHVPASVRTIITRCLTKEPAQRYQSAREVRAALEAVQSDVSMVPPTPTEAIRTPRRMDKRLTGAVLAASAVVLLAVWMARRGAPRAPDGSGRLVQVVTSDRQATDPALSPDGTMVAYVAEDEAGRLDLYVTRVAGGGRVRLTDDDARETHPRFSPDGERIAFARRAADGSGPAVCVIPALGGQITAVLPSGGHPAWSPVGERIAFIRQAEGGGRTFLATARSDGSDVRDLLRGDGELPFVRAPAWSPDGRLIAFVRGRGGVSGELWLVDAERATPPRRLSADPPAVFSDDPTFSVDGSAIVHSSNRGGATNIWALPLDGTPARRLTTGPGPDEFPTVDRDGRLAFVNSRWRNELLVHDLRTGHARSLVRHTPFLWAPAFSPDGRELAFSRGEVDGSWHVWATDLEGGPPRQLTRSDQGELYSRWTPDGRSVLYQNWGAPRRVWRVPREGGPPVAVTPPGLEASYPDLSPDGRSLAFVSMQENEERVFVMPVDGSRAPRLLRPRAASLPRWSPDGSWIAFAPNRGYFGGVFVVRSDGTDERKVAPTGGWPVWWPDGKRIAYLIVRGDLTQRIETVGLDGSGQAALPIRFAHNNNPFDISRDGTLLATSDSVHVSSEIWVVEPR